MTIQETKHGRTLVALVLACALAAFTVEPAAAQTAKKLKCSGCVKSKQIKDGGVKNADLANGSVNGLKITDGTVGNADLAGGAVTSDKVADGAVGNADLADGAVDSAKVQNNSLTGADISDNSLTANDLATNSVGSSEVLGDSIPSGDLSNEAGVDFVGGNNSVALSTTAAVIQTVTLSAPSSGFVIVHANGGFSFVNHLTTDEAVCSITTSTGIEIANQIFAREQSPDAMYWVPFASTRVFPAPVGGGSATYNLVCDLITGSASVFDTYLTALFVPTQY